MAAPLILPESGGTRTGTAAAGAPALFEVDPSSASLVDATVHASGGPTRLVLRDASGAIVVESDGQAPGHPDDQILEHVEAGRYFLEVDALAGPVAFTLAASVAPASEPGTVVPLATPPSLEFAPVAFGHFTNPGTVDVAALDGLHAGLGDGTFAPAGPALTDPFNTGYTLPSKGADPAGSVAGNFTGTGLDGLATLVKSTGSTPGSALAVYPTPIAGGFGTPTVIPIDIIPSASVSTPTEPLVAGDFTGSGLDSVALIGTRSSDGEGVLEILPNLGHGTFGPAVTIDLAGLTPTAITTGDFTGDGRTDLAVAGMVNGRTVVETWVARAGGGFQETQPIDLGPGSPITELVSGRFDGSKRDGLAAISGTTLDVFRARPDGSLMSGPGVTLAGFSAYVLTTGDYTGGGIDGIVVAGPDPLGNGVVAPYLWSAQGELVAQPREGLGQLLPTTLASGHFSGDGRVDLAVAGDVTNQSFRSLEILPGLGNGQFGPSPTGQSGSLANVPAIGVVGGEAPPVPGDFGGTGVQGLAVLEVDATGVNYLDIQLPAGDGTFREGTRIPLGNLDSVQAMASGDFSGDGRIDVALLVTDGSGRSELEVVLNQGNGRFETTPALRVSSLGRPSLLAGDFAGTGQDQVVLVGQAAGGTSIDVSSYVLNPDGTIGQAGDSRVPGSLASVAVGPFLGDGHSELAVAGSFLDPSRGFFGSGVAILAGASDGTFSIDTLAFLSRFKATTLFPQKILAFAPGGGGPESVVVDGTLSGTGGASGSFVEVLGNDGSGDLNVQSATALPGVTLVDSAVGDLAGAGAPSLALLERDPRTQADSIVLETIAADGTLASGPSLPIALQQATRLVAGDFLEGGRSALALLGNDSSAGVLEFLREVGTAAPPPVLITTGIFDGAALSTTGPELAVDLNGDGRPDIVAPTLTSGGQSALGVELGTGVGTFQDSSAIPLGTAVPVALAAGDMNADGLIDLVAAAETANGDASLMVALGDGYGDFAAPVATPLGRFAPVALVMGDFAGPGHAELALAGYEPDGSSAIELFSGRADGSLALAQVIPLGGISVRGLLASGSSLVVAGNDGEGRGRVEILGQAGNGTVALSRTIDLDGVDLSTVVAGTFGSPGQTDLAVLGASRLDGSMTLEVVLAAASGSPVILPPEDLGAVVPAGLLVGDANGDGKADLVVVSGFSPTTYQTLLGNGAGGFAEVGSSTSLSERPGPTVAADFAGDHKLDLALATSDQGVRVAFGAGNGQYSLGASPVAPASNDPVVSPLGTGTLDAFIVDQSGAILWRRGRAGQDGAFRPPIIINPGVPSKQITLITTARGAEIVSLDALDDAVSVFAFDGTQFTRTAQFAVGGTPLQMVSADLNGDGATDLVILVKSGTGETASIELGDGSGGFRPGASLAVPAGTSKLALVDLDGSGRVDLVATDATAGEVRVYPGLGDGSFELARVYSAGPDARGVVNGTLASGDGTSGLAVGKFGPGGSVSVVALDPGSRELVILDGLAGGALANPRVVGTSSATVVRAGTLLNGAGFVATLEPGLVRIYVGDGSGGLVEVQDVLVSSDATGLSVSTISGRPALLVGDRYGDVEVLLADASGQFSTLRNNDQPVTLALLSASSGGAPTFFYADQGLDQVVQVGPAPAASASNSKVIAQRGDGLRVPGAVSLKDLNGDGVPDIVVVDSGANDVLVYLGDGRGSYASKPLVFPVGTDPASVTVAQLTSSPLPDLIVANRGSNDVSILVGKVVNGAWTLVPLTRIPVGLGPTSTAVVPMPGQALPNILVSDSGSNQIQTLTPAGAGLYAVSPIAIPTGNLPGPLLIGNFGGQPGELDAATLDLGSGSAGQITVVFGINGPNPFVSDYSSGGVDPVAAVVVPGVGAGEGLLVANNGDGAIALFLAGAEGFGMASSFTAPGLANPSALAIDGAAVYGVNDGSESAVAISISLGLGIASPSGGAILEPGGLSSALAEQQVAVLIPLGRSTLALAATLLSVAVESTSEFTVVEGAGGLPNQAPKVGEDTKLETATEPDDPDAPGSEPPPAQGTNTPENDVARFLGGLGEALERARERIEHGALVPESTLPATPAPAAPAPGAVDAAIESPEVHESVRNSLASQLAESSDALASERAMDAAVDVDVNTTETDRSATSQRLGVAEVAGLAVLVAAVPVVRRVARGRSRFTRV